VAQRRVLSSAGGLRARASVALPWLTHPDLTWRDLPGLIVFLCRLQLSRRTLPTRATVAAADFTINELDHLASWGRANRLEVTVEVAGSDLDEEVAYIGQSFGIASWTIHRSNGHLCLSLIGGWAGRHRTGWTMAVSSVEMATARIAGMLATGWRYA